jgi:hypothetical protein
MSEPTDDELRVKKQELDYLKQRQTSILLKIEDLEKAVSSGFSLDSYEPEDPSLETAQPQDSAFARAFLEAERRIKDAGGGAQELVDYRGTDSVPSTPSRPSAEAPPTKTGGSPGTPLPPRVKSGRRTEAELKMDQALLNACYFGNTNGVIKLIRQGADVEYMEGSFVSRKCVIFGITH